MINFLKERFKNSIDLKRLRSENKNLREEIARERDWRTEEVEKNQYIGLKYNGLSKQCNDLSEQVKNYKTKIEELQVNLATQNADYF